GAVPRPRPVEVNLFDPVDRSCARAVVAPMVRLAGSKGRARAPHEGGSSEQRGVELDALALVLAVQIEAEVVDVAAGLELDQVATDLGARGEGLDLDRRDIGRSSELDCGDPPLGARSEGEVDGPAGRSRGHRQGSMIHRTRRATGGKSELQGWVAGAGGRQHRTDLVRAVFGESDQCSAWRRTCRYGEGDAGSFAGAVRWRWKYRRG